MKKSLLKILAIALLSGFLSSCAEEEIVPQDQLNTTKGGVTKDDGGF